MTETQARDPERKIPTRRMAFEESFQKVPRHFAQDGDLIGSHLAAALSSVFPDGEDFFVRSVRHYRDQITDPELKRQVAGFIGQESVHGREHRAFNDRLGELGYPAKRYERITDRALRFRERVLSPESNLAVTAALEHFTATLAELIMTNDEAREQFGDPAVMDLFIWHALEESEHKAVAFDVYKAVGGREKPRVMIMNFFRYGFPIGMGFAVLISLIGDWRSCRHGELRASWRRFKKSPLVSRDIWERLRDYNRPDFHPDDHDATELVRQWREKLFGEYGTLNDKMAGSSSAA